MKTQLLETLTQFANKRPNRSFADYGDRAIYNRYSREITRDLHHARELIRKVELSGIDADQIIAASKRAFTGRLTINKTESGYELDYCTGQYFPTEYRKAVCAVLSTALYNYYSENIPVGINLKKVFRRNFSRSVANNYFN